MSPEELQELVSRVEAAAEEYSLKINASKTEVMTNTEEVLEVLVAGARLRQLETS